VPVSKGFRAVGAARPIISALFEATYELGDVPNPVDVQSLGVILCANRAINTPQKMNELTMLTSLNPTVVVFLNSAGTLASLTAIPTILSILAQAPIFKPWATILCIPNGSNDRSKLPTHLGPNVGLDGLIVEEGVTDAVLLQNGIVGLVLSNASEAEEESSNESHVYHYTHTIDTVNHLSLAWYRKILRDSDGTMRRLRPIPCVS